MPKPRKYVLINGIEYTGVSLHKPSGRYYIQADRKRKYFRTPVEARTAYRAMSELHPGRFRKFHEWSYLQSTKKPSQHWQWRRFVIGLDRQEGLFEGQAILSRRDTPREADRPQEHQAGCCPRQSEHRRPGQEAAYGAVPGRT